MGVPPAKNIADPPAKNISFKEYKDISKYKELEI